MNPIENLLKYKLELPEVSTPGGSYVSLRLMLIVGYKITT